MNGMQDHSRGKIRSSTTMLLMAAIQIILSARTAPYNIDQCDYDEGEGFSLIKGTTDCLKFTNGVIPEYSIDTF